MELHSAYCESKCLGFGISWWQASFPEHACHTILIGLTTPQPASGMTWSAARPFSTTRCLKVGCNYWIVRFLNLASSSSTWPKLSRSCSKTVINTVSEKLKLGIVLKWLWNLGTWKGLHIVLAGIESERLVSKIENIRKKKYRDRSTRLYKTSREENKISIYIN